MTTIYIQLICITIILCVISMWLHGIYNILAKKDKELEENNLVEFVWEDENGNGIYRLK
jgi:hypothetical protein